MRNYAIILVACLSACGGGTSPPPPPDPPPPAQQQSTPPPVTHADDYPAVQALLNAGGTVTLSCRDYYFSKMLMVSQSGTTLQGCGATTVLHWTPPAKGQNVSCVNDRAIAVNCGISFYQPRQVLAPIAAGDTTMQVADSSGINVGDWLMVGDWGVLGTYTSVVDWVQVSAVEGALITFTAPCRVAVDTSQPFVPYTSGGGFVRMIDLEHVTLQDFTVQVDPLPAGANNFPAVGVTGSIGTTFQRLTINDPAGNPFWTYFSKGTVVADSTANGSFNGSEIASSVDFSITGSTFSGVGLSLDLGAAYFTVSGNKVQSPANIGMYLTDNVHDGTISDNAISNVVVTGGVSNAVGIYLSGSPNVKLTSNTLTGGAGGGSIGIYVAAGSVPGFSWPDTGDVLSGNTITGYARQVEGP